jgi:Tol biopolymer transport system component
MNGLLSFSQHASGRLVCLPGFRLVATILFFSLAIRAVASASAGTTTLVSIASDGTQTNSWSLEAALSADGRFVAFYSAANNLVPEDTNGHADVFVHDQLTGLTERVSMAADGTQANHASDSPRLSADGRYIAFTSLAGNLVAGDWNETGDIFVHDRQTGETERVSVAANGAQTDAGSDGASISADGRFVAFTSYAWNLVPNDTNEFEDVFVHDRQTGLTKIVSVASAGTLGNLSAGRASLSADGRFVAFESQASNLTQVATLKTKSKLSARTKSTTFNSKPSAVTA